MKCPNCGFKGTISREEINKRISAGMRASKMKLGRNRKFTYKEIAEMKQSGMSLYRIHLETGASRSTICRALRESK